MRYRILFLTILVILSFAPIAKSASQVGESGIEITIKNNTILIQGYTIISTQIYNPYTGTYTEIPQKFVSLTDNLFINKVNETINPINRCENVTFDREENGTIKRETCLTNCSAHFDYYKEIPFLNFRIERNQSQPTITDQATLQRYDQCLMEKAQYIAGLNACVENKNKQEDFEKKYGQCSNELNACLIERNITVTERNRLFTEYESKKNQNWVYGVGGLILGIIGTLWLSGKIGGPKAPNIEGIFNRQQSA